MSLRECEWVKPKEDGSIRLFQDDQRWYIIDVEEGHVLTQADRKQYPDFDTAMVEKWGWEWADGYEGRKSIAPESRDEGEQRYMLEHAARSRKNLLTGTWVDDILAKAMLEDTVWKAAKIGIGDVVRFGTNWWVRIAITDGKYNDYKKLGRATEGWKRGDPLPDHIKEAAEAAAKRAAEKKPIPPEEKKPKEPKPEPPKAPEEKTPESDLLDSDPAGFHGDLALKLLAHEPHGLFTPDEVLEAVKKMSREDKLALAKRIGYHAPEKPKPPKEPAGDWSKKPLHDRLDPERVKTDREGAIKELKERVARSTARPVTATDPEGRTVTRIATDPEPEYGKMTDAELAKAMDYHRIHVKPVALPDPPPPEKYEEAIKYMEDHGGWKFIRPAKSMPKAKRESQLRMAAGFAALMKRHMEKFPALRFAVYEVGEYGKVFKPLRYGSSTWAAMSEFGRRMGLSDAGRDMDEEKWRRATRASLMTKWHPPGTGSVKAVLDHEMGHAIHFFLKAKDPIIQAEWDRFGRTGRKEKITEELSTYAATNIKEFIAEAWSEWMNNPSPRPLATKIGKQIESIINYKYGEGPVPEGWET